MTYRQISTATWQDPWFERLSSKAKLLFIYLWTNDVCNQAGLFQISQRRIEFEVGFKVDDVIGELKDKVEWFPAENIVWVKNFFKWQCCNPKFAIGACRSLHCIPKQIVDQFIQHNLSFLEKYGIDTVSIPYAQGVGGVCVSETETETETETTPPIAPPLAGISNPSAESQLSSPNGDGFSVFWQKYPRKTGKLAALKAWKKLKTPATILPKILEAIELQRASPQWCKDGGQYIPNPATWLNQGRWEDEVAKPESEMDRWARERGIS